MLDHCEGYSLERFVRVEVRSPRRVLSREGFHENDFGELNLILSWKTGFIGVKINVCEKTDFGDQKHQRPCPHIPNAIIYCYNSCERAFLGHVPRRKNFLYTNTHSDSEYSVTT